MRRVVLSLALSALATFVTRSAFAQPVATCEGVEAPAVLAQLGAQLAQNGAWDSAAVCFERLRARATDSGVRGDAVFNLGIAYQSLGRHRDARDTFAEWLQSHAPEADEATQAEAARLFAQESARVCAIVVAVPAVEGREVRLDGRVVAVEGAQATLETDPGDHALIVTAPGHTTFTWDGHVADGQRERVDVSLVPLPHQGGDVASEPAFWVGMVLLAGAVAGGVIAGVVLQDAAQLDARMGITVLRL